MDSRSSSTFSLLKARKHRYLVLGVAAVLDTVLVVAALVGANLLWFSGKVPAANALFYEQFFLPYIAAKLAFFLAFGLYNAYAFETRSLTVLRILEVISLSTIVELGVATSILFYNESDLFKFSRPALLLKGGIEILTLSIARIAVIKVVESLKLLQHTTLVVGTVPHLVSRILGPESETPIRRIAGYVDREAMADLPEGSAAWLGTPDEIGRLIPEHKVDELIILGNVEMRNAVLSRIICHSLSIKVLAQGLESVLSKRQTYEVHDIPLLEINRSSLSLTTVFGKRMMDSILAGFGLLVTSPLMGLLWMYYGLFEGGDLIYTQQRIGRDGRLFKVFKIRTMVRDAEKATGADKSHGGDERVLGLGRLLRRTHVDELPQLWNIFRGDMSFVGPRPERPELAREYQAENPAYNLRHIVRPGLTGLAQVRGSYDSSYDSKLFYDLLYAFNVTLMMDLQILYYTPKYILAELFGEKNQY